MHRLGGVSVRTPRAPSASSRPIRWVVCAFIFPEISSEFPGPSQLCHVVPDSPPVRTRLRVPSSLGAPRTNCAGQT